MKYTLEITIDLPREKVVELFMNPANLKYWQKGFISMETYKGEPGKEGSRSKIKHKEINGVTEVTETIVKLNLPQEIHMTQTTDHVSTSAYHFFKEIDGKTIWIFESVLKFSGAMKIMAFMVGSEPYQNKTKELMEDFKAFANGKPIYGGK
jgi:hypothetical protein